MADYLVKEDGTGKLLLEGTGGFLKEVNNPSGSATSFTIEVAGEFDTTACSIELAFEADYALDIRAASQTNPGRLGYLRQEDDTSHFDKEDDSGVLTLETGPFVRLSSADVAVEIDTGVTVIAIIHPGGIRANTLSR